MIEMKELCKINAAIQMPYPVPGGPLGLRQFVPVPGGTIEGERLNGKFLPGGADAGLLRQDQVFEIDLRAPIQLDDGTVIYMRANGLSCGPEEIMKQMPSDAIDPSEYYFREVFYFEAPPGPHEWLNRIMALGTGSVSQISVKLDVYEIL